MKTPTWFFLGLASNCHSVTYPVAKKVVKRPMRLFKSI